ncbi:hypothetical protein MFUL124B02_21855 [Myxococcus fulvus 124B02]|nr:hypothetical protein MFUL124B02_21855 [Myxococcus fulvus 124B02]
MWPVAHPLAQRTLSASYFAGPRAIPMSQFLLFLDEQVA